MKRTIQRRYEFHPEDIKDALEAWLRAADKPLPNGQQSSEMFRITAEGAEWSWTEEMQ